MTLARGRRILYVTLVLALAAFAVAHVRILPVASTLLLGLAGLWLARPTFVSLPAAFGAQFGFLVGAAIEGATIGAAARHDVSTLALALVFLVPAIGLVVPGADAPATAPLPVARARRRRWT